MPHENKKMYMSSKSTGTIPKVKQRNNNNAGAGAERRSNLVSNNLGNEFEAAEANRRNRNPNRNLHFFHMMDVNQECAQNGMFSSSGTLTSNESNTMSRRNSSGLSKCDNVPKYPDKKQIESKLSQIQEYLQVATSMKANMKKTDDQIQSISIPQSNNLSDEPMDDEQLDAIIKDLTDSAVKLQTILADIEGIEGTEKCQQFSDGSEHLDPEVIRQNKNELERKVDVATRDLQMLKEQENYLLHLQLNAENKLREARNAQAKLAKSAQPQSQTMRNTNANSETEWCNDSDSFSVSGASSGRNMDMRELEERIKSFNVDDPKVFPEQFQGQIDHLQNHIQQMRENNDNRTQLIQILDTRDAQLQAQHSSLQGKLQELQNKKHQVDQLVVQLQTMNEESEEDEMGCHVKKIVNMKEQLTKLKDMLNLVQTTEESIDGHEQNDDGINAEIEENVNRLIAKTDNLMQQQNRIPHVENVENVANVAPRSNYPSSSSNERRVKEKQVNKKSMNANEKERRKLQAEMRAKRKELEELMCKHKAANSNLNHDNHSEKNSDMGAHENGANAWYPMDSNIFNTRVEHASSESDDGREEDPNEFSEMNSSGELNSAVVQPMPAFSYPTANYIRQRSSQESQSPRVEMPHDSFATLSSRSPARSVRSTTPAFPPRESAPSRSQIQKQLELIKTVCDSMLESNQEHEDAEQTAPVRVRNNLTPSPIYTEPRHFSPRPNLPAASSTNALNVVNYPEVPMTMQMPPNISPNDAAAYNNWLTTNSLQTQAFILNTLNQCCQMLWHQQKELSTLRNTVSVMQDRFGNVYHDENTPLCMQSNPCIYQPNLSNILPTPPSNNYMPNNYRHPMKTNQMTPNLNLNPSSGSMPNLNGHCAHPSTSSATNMEHAAFCNNMMPNNSAGAAGAPNIIGEHHQLNSNLNHIMHPNQNVPTPIWNGQALNNQVAPGNRANNYWDNFRSYSRQNLFSTKSNDGTQNFFNERSNQTSERHRSVNQDVVSSSSLLAKSNSNSNHNETATGASSVENSPRRISVPKRRVAATGATGRDRDGSPERKMERTPERQVREKPANNEGAFALPLTRIDSEFSVHTADEMRSTRNEWPTESTISQKTKLFEDLRENVYKEVASLISANEERPHFLIQLFQDLQLVSSDPLRRNVLHSVQELITTSAVSSSRQHLLQNEAEPRQHEESSAEYELLTMPHDASATTSDGNMSDIADAQSDLQRASLMWPMISKRSIVIDHESQEQFNEALSSFLNIRQDDEAYIEMSGEAKFMMPFAHAEEEMEIPRLQILVQNGDLAEADQSCAAEEDDEGAVGGLLNILERSASSNAGQICLEVDVIPETEDESEQGLDQVPTRLSNPPSSIGCSPKSQ